MKVYRAHDGRALDVNQPLAQFQSLDDLLDCFSLATGIPSDFMICMTSDGAQLKDEVIDQILEDHSNQHEFFVFNRDFLFSDPDSLSAELAIVPTLEPQVHELELSHPPTPRSLEALVSWSSLLVSYITHHHARSSELLSHLTTIQRSTSVALLNLVSHADSVKRGEDALGDFAGKELARMQGLLEGHERDLLILGMVSINPKLLTGGSSTGSAGSDGKHKSSKERTLGDYISRVKMEAVADACTKVFNELRERIAFLAETMSQMSHDLGDLRSEIEGTSVQPSVDTLDESTQALSRARDILRFIEDHCLPDAQGWPVADKLDEPLYTEIIQMTDELLLLDEVARESVRRLTADNNDMLARSLHLLQDISSLQSEFADLSSALVAVEADLTSNKVDGFKHLARLKNMLWAYGATVVEVVRRREFARHFLSKSQSLAELMAKLSAAERKRRQEYRSDVVGQLPWEVKGMDEAAPSLEITTTRTGGEGVAEVDREDLDLLFKLLDAVDQKLAEAEQSQGFKSPIPEVRAALEQLSATLDSMENEFVLLVNRNLIGMMEDSDDESASGSEGRLPRLRNGKSAAALTSVKEVEDLRKKLEDAKKAHQASERRLTEEHGSETERLKREIESLKKELQGERDRLDAEGVRYASTKEQLEHIKADYETEQERRMNMADEVSDLRRQLEESRRGEAKLQQEVAEAVELETHYHELQAELEESRGKESAMGEKVAKQAERVIELETNLQAIQLELEEAKAARLDAANRIEALLCEGSSAEKELSAAQNRINELTEQVSSAHAEVKEAKDALVEAEAAKEKQIRTHRAEADGDRAILEEKVRALQDDLEKLALEASESLEKARMAESIRGTDREAVELLRSQLQAADEAHEEIVKEMERARELALEAQISKERSENATQSLLERTRPILSKFYHLRKAVRAMPAMSSSKNASSNAAGKDISARNAAMSLSVVSETERQAALDAFEAEAETADVETTLDALRCLDPDELFDEVKAKLDSLTTLVRKWQKAYKSSNDKTQKALNAAKDKIAFRNFQVGDLALFLPTRNSTAKPWAAFNISFPHFFLHATGQMADQLKTKEWIVARITSITDRVANSSSNGDEEGGGNPFQLAEGVRYYLLDVEGWNSSQAAPSLRNRKSNAAAINDGEGRGQERKRSDTLPRTVGGSIVSATTAEVSEARSDMMPRRASEGAKPSTETTVQARNDATTARSLTPPMMTPEGSPPQAGVLLSPDVTDVNSSKPEQISAAKETSPVPAFSGPSSVLSDSAAVASPSAPSGLTRALRASSPAAARYDPISGRPWHSPPVAVDILTGPGAKRVGIVEAAAPAFGRGRDRSKRPEMIQGGRGLGAMNSAPASQTVNGQMAIAAGMGASRPSAITSALADRLQESSATVTNPFSQSPAPASLADRDFFGKDQQRAAAAQTSTRDGFDRLENVKSAGDRDGEAPAGQGWGKDATKVGVTGPKVHRWSVQGPAVAGGVVDDARGDGTGPDGSSEKKQASTAERSKVASAISRARPVGGSASSKLSPAMMSARRTSGIVMVNENSLMLPSSISGTSLSSASRLSASPARTSSSPSAVRPIASLASAMGETSHRGSPSNDGGSEFSFASTSTGYQPKKSRLDPSRSAQAAARSERMQSFGDDESLAPPRGVDSPRRSQEKQPSPIASSSSLGGGGGFLSQTLGRFSSITGGGGGGGTLISGSSRKRSGLGVRGEGTIPGAFDRAYNASSPGAGSSLDSDATGNQVGGGLDGSGGVGSASEILRRLNERR
ncbi:hypothetical protein IE53DRAFT_238653 [Violaceomyces palustris]|uniref:Uncharacterized protein n=1 Tax=Violaceomyces palustris TaxID=1673888 RepID=A0ACD0NP94_9BASI|nr:hypothetical protein IE53DRAFT_238653 [Violaceomyces palustris]